MTAPIEQGLSDVIPPVDAVLRSYLEREVLPVLRKAREIINEGNSYFTDNAGNYEWDMGLHGNLFINQTSGAPTFSVASNVDPDLLRPGRQYTLTMQNSTGGVITPAFSSDFNANTAAVPSGSRAAWRFFVKHRDMTSPAATFLEFP